MQFLAISTLAMLFAAAFAAPIPVPEDQSVVGSDACLPGSCEGSGGIGNDPGHKGGPALTSRTSNTPAGSDACLPGSCEGGGGTGGDPGHKGGPTSTL
ncbi:unnamed protein product [Zymoseptoria tritici ST99CH_3D7]|uniref:Uncharacterized protein n=1 Tax=Zymoseptoria tritici (strain ST99CH_3D7) TaxID=1276538 RepID=A0A1X7RUD9_ZYMT9|nr:unnamed protein product [Zymoseptoria tritici ST99CH_3D7]